MTPPCWESSMAPGTPARNPQAKPLKKTFFAQKYDHRLFPFQSWLLIKNVSLSLRKTPIFFSLQNLLDWIPLFLWEDFHHDDVDSFVSSSVHFVKKFRFVLNHYILYQKAETAQDVRKSNRARQLVIFSGNWSCHKYDLITLLMFLEHESAERSELNARSRCCFRLFWTNN